MISEAQKSFIPQRLKNYYTDFELQKEGYCYRIYSVKSLLDGKTYHAHVLDTNNEFYQKNPNLATTQFIRELVYLGVFARDYVQIESIEFSEPALGYITEPLMDPHQLKYNELLETIEECKRLTNQLLICLETIHDSLDVPLRLTSKNISWTADRQRFFLTDPSNIISTHHKINDDFEFERKLQRNNFNESEQIYSIGLTILQLKGAKESDLDYLSGIKNRKSYQPALQTAIKELNISESISALVQRMLDPQETNRLKREELSGESNKKDAETQEPDLKPLIQSKTMLDETKMTLADTLKSTKDSNDTEIQSSERVQISPPDRFPFSAIGIVRYYREETQEIFWGTGTLIGPNIVLTAAYNLFDLRTNKYHTKVEFVLLENPGLKTFEIESCYVPEQWRNANTENGDDMIFNFGVVVLKEPIGKSVGYLGLHVSETSAPLKWKKFNLVGYPKDKVAEKENCYELWGGTSSVAFDSSQNMLLYDIQTDLGQGGAALYYENDKGEYYVVGLHTGAYSKDEKFGTWIKPEYFNEISKCIQASGGEFKISSFNPKHKLKTA